MEKIKNMLTRHIRTIAFILVLAMGFCLGACCNTASADQNHPLKIWMQNTNGYAHTWNIVDETTSVNYIVVTTERGNGEMSIAITPRLNADGTLYTSPSH